MRQKIECMFDPCSSFVIFSNSDAATCFSRQASEGRRRLGRDGGESSRGVGRAVAAGPEHHQCPAEVQRVSLQHCFTKTFSKLG